MTVAVTRPGGQPPGTDAGTDGEIYPVSIHCVTV